VGGTCSTHGVGRRVYRILVGGPERKKPLGRPRRRWEDNIKTDLAMGQTGLSRTESGEIL